MRPLSVPVNALNGLMLAKKTIHALKTGVRTSPGLKVSAHPLTVKHWMMLHRQEVDMPLSTYGPQLVVYWEQSATRLPDPQFSTSSLLQLQSLSPLILMLRYYHSEIMIIY